MTDSTHRAHSQAAEPVSSRGSFVQLPKELIRYIRTLKLTGTQYDLLMYLWELDPYGDRWVEIPPPSAIASLLNVDPRTIQRAAQRLADCELFDFDIKAWRCRNTTVSVKTRDYSTGKEIRMPTKRSKRRQNDPNVENGIILSENGQNDPNVVLEPAQDKGSDSLHTLHTDPYSLIGERETEIDPKFRAWLITRSQRLPLQPALLEQWIAVQARIEANQRDFLQSLQVPDRIDLPPPPLPNVFLQEEEKRQRLLTLRQWWDSGQGDRVQQLIAEHPEWGLTLDADQGVVERC